jgi:hypothetical protein
MVNRFYVFSTKLLTLKLLTLTPTLIEKHILHYRQLYEQLSIKKATSDEMAMALGLHVKGWQRWVYAGIPSAIINFYSKTFVLSLFLKST